MVRKGHFKNAVSAIRLKAMQARPMGLPPYGYMKNPDGSKAGLLMKKPPLLSDGYSV